MLRIYGVKVPVKIWEQGTEEHAPSTEPGFGLTECVNMQEEFDFDGVHFYI